MLNGMLSNVRCTLPTDPMTKSTNNLTSRSVSQLANFN